MPIRFLQVLRTCNKIRWGVAERLVSAAQAIAPDRVMRDVIRENAHLYATPIPMTWDVYSGEFRAKSSYGWVNVKPPMRTRIYSWFRRWTSPRSDQAARPQQ